MAYSCAVIHYDCIPLCPPWCAPCPLKLDGHCTQVEGHSKIFSGAGIRAAPLSICFLHLCSWSRDGVHVSIIKFVFCCLNGLAPSYLSCDLLRVSDLAARQRLRSSSTSTLVVPPTRLSTARDCAFPVAAARTWNNLSRSLTSLPSPASFRRQLKTELFSRSFPDLDSSAHDRI